MKNMASGLAQSTADKDHHRAAYFHSNNNSLGTSPGSTDFLHLPAFGWMIVG